MISIAQQLADARTTLAEIAGANAGLEARVLAAHAWGMTTEQLVLASNDVRDQSALGSLIGRRLQHEPVAQILGQKHFWKDAFSVSRAVLTPRADSETIMETLLRLRPDVDAALRVLDLGTGSGCLLLSALRDYTHAKGVGVDQSEDAITIAVHNAAALGLGERSHFVRSNWCEALEGTFDVILSNPPYIPTADILSLDADIRDFEPHAALDGGADGLDCYRRLVHEVKPHLKPNALLLFEVGMGQAADVAALGEAAGWKLLEITSDLAGIARVVAFQRHA